MARAHEITITPLQHRVEVSVKGVAIATSDRPLVLRETGLPDRYYLPRDDVREDVLRPSGTTSTCPFKGRASYWSVQIGNELVEDVVWSYEEPIPGREAIAGLLCFYNERVARTVDGLPA